MKSILFTVLGTVFITFSLTAQPNLLPHIGIENEPSPEEPICDIPLYLGAFDVSGYDVGGSVADFSLYTPDGERHTLSDVLEDGKPALLVSANYTCWRYRDQIANVNAVANYFEEEIETFYVYTVEAHPQISISPYSGEVWTGQRNFTDEILYEQPETYGERLDIIEEMRAEFGIVPKILVDDPCNQWWLNFGPAPNNAYLIDTDGMVQMKHAWLNANPDNLWCDISGYLHQENENCNEAGLNGSFEVTYSLPEGNTAYGSPGEILTIPTTIQNLSETDNVEVNIIRENVYTQEDWLTALCVDVCYNHLVSNATVTIPPGGSQSFIFYFYTGVNEGAGTANVRFENAFSVSNFQILDFQGVTGVTTGINDAESDSWTVFPNPALDFVNIDIPASQIGETVSLFDISGRLVHQRSLSTTTDRLDLNAVPVGMYFVRIGGSNKFHGKLVIR